MYYLLEDITNDPSLNFQIDCEPIKMLPNVSQYMVTLHMICLNHLNDHSQTKDLLGQYQNIFCQCLNLNLKFIFQT
jgi:hypothetical protein